MSSYASFRSKRRSVYSIMLSAVLLAGLGLCGLVYQPTMIAAKQVAGWNEVSVAGCQGYYWPSTFRSGIVFCAGEFDFRAIDLVKNTVSVISAPDSKLAISVFFEDSTTGVMIGRNINSCCFGAYRSADGGVTWQPTKWNYSLYTSIFSAGYGSNTYYSWESASYPSTLRKSNDGGQTWTALEYNHPLLNKGGAEAGFALHPANPNLLYVAGNVVKDKDNNTTSVTLFRSEDGGASWKNISSLSVDYVANRVEMTLPQSKQASPDAVQVLFQKAPGPVKFDPDEPSSGKATYFISQNRGETFAKFFEDDNAAGFYERALTEGYDGTLYTVRRDKCDVPGQCKVAHVPQVSIDGGVSWQPLGLPDAVKIYTPEATPNVVYAVTRELNAATPYPYRALYRSLDKGKNWTRLEGFPLDAFYAVHFTDYLPFRLAIAGKDKLYHFNDTTAEKTVTAAFSPIPQSMYFEATKHNLGGIFEKYWQANGGLAQFGYPKTEVFRELNPSDGKIYPVQYFERNRFERHAENAGTKYEVLLGLLGNQLTAARRGNGEGAFNRFDNANYPGGLYFPETGHNLRNSFKNYWEANGGLSLYGYPVSEEFSEVNPDDGKTYVVQYFERNRFEYHPENKDTKYEVLLGLLGNTLLKQKGWN